MKNTIRLLTLIIALAIISSCNSKPGPRAVLKNFFERVSEKDSAGASQLVSSKGNLIFQFMMTRIRSSKVDKNVDETENFKLLRIGDSRMMESKAYVQFGRKDDIFFEVPMKQENGDWKVDLDPYFLNALSQSRTVWPIR